MFSYIISRMKSKEVLVDDILKLDIIQGDYIIGAVTHVVIDDPLKGYGIFITNMLEEGEN